MTVSESRNERTKTPYKVDVEPIPMDTLTVYGTGGKPCWFRIPSWRVHFDHEPLKGYDLRLHRSVDSNAVWALSEASTGFQFFSDIAHEHYIGDEGAMLAEFAAGLMLKMTPEKLVAGLAKAREKLSKLPPNPMISAPSEKAARVDETRSSIQDEEARLLHDVLNLARETLFIGIQGSPEELHRSLGRLNLACKAHWDWQTGRYINQKGVEPPIEFDK